MTGMEMMLKSFGINPEEIKAGIIGLVATVKEVDARLERIETAQHQMVIAIDAIAERQINGRIGDDGYEPAGVGPSTERIGTVSTARIGGK